MQLDLPPGFQRARISVFERPPRRLHLTVPQTTELLYSRSSTSMPRSFGVHAILSSAAVLSSLVGSTVLIFRCSYYPCEAMSLVLLFPWCSCVRVCICFLVSGSLSTILIVTYHNSFYMCILLQSSNLSSFPTFFPIY